jgi:hypothetical protein
MLERTVRIHICLLFTWLLALPLVPPLWAQHTPTDIEGTSKIKGKIVSTEDRDRVRGARVLAFHLSSAQLFVSEPITKGGFEIRGLPYGYYDLAVEATDGLYPATQVINLAPSGTATLVLTLASYHPATAGLARKFPNQEAEPSGTAEVLVKLRGRHYWRSPGGVAILSGLGGVALLALAAGSDNEVVATTINVGAN